MAKRVLILGSGPSGLTAGIYAARGGLDATVVKGSQAGGQLMLTTEVENYPGFSEPIMGPNLIEEMTKQAERLGVKFVEDEAVGVDFSSSPLKVKLHDRTLSADAIIIGTGASALWLGLESEQRLRGRGVSSCATCDGFFFRGKEVVVVGGGDTAVEEALFLSRLASKVTVIHRRDELRASRIMQQRALTNPKISFVWDSSVEEVLGKDKVEGVRIRNIKTGQVSELSSAGVFVAIGHKPNSEIFAGQLELDEKGYIKSSAETRTSVEGVFVAGDVYDYLYRQAVTAAASGCKAAIDATKYLEAQEESKG
ncbi:MAG: thioredoxin-disulfide reductase [Thaumarchaeota archaeon]|nr:thioredoxin-disulfide reductase [Nitrososphaerota archaeon]